MNNINNINDLFKIAQICFDSKEYNKILDKYRILNKNNNELGIKEFKEDLIDDLICILKEVKYKIYSKNFIERNNL